MCELKRTLDNEMKLQEFLGVKGQFREMSDLNARREAERQARRKYMEDKIASLANILKTIKQFAGKMIRRLRSHNSLFISRTFSPDVASTIINISFQIDLNLPNIFHEKFRAYLILLIGFNVNVRGPINPTNAVEQANKTSTSLPCSSSNRRRRISRSSIT